MVKRSRWRLAGVIGTTTLLGSAHAQVLTDGSQPPKGPAFQVASIHVHPPDQRGRIGFYGTPGGGVECGICKLSTLVEYALNIDGQLISGIPDWAGKVYYDIRAVPPDDSPSRKLNLSGFTASPSVEQRDMLLNLLVERFGFRYHAEERSMPVYLLERGSGPTTLEPPKYPERAADPRGGLVQRGDLTTGEGFGQSMTMDFLAKSLTRPLERPVVDHTGIAGVHDFHVDPIDTENRDRFAGAMLMVRALGLKLSPGRAPVRTIHVDAATPPTEN